MNEETKSKDAAVIQLTPAQYAELERAMQWPEDLPRYDRNARPTPLHEIFQGEL